jgi:hypothetical protein
MPATPTTEDGHFIVVDGRRWRATDPAIPEQFRRKLVDELMDARRAVAAARRAADPAAEAAAHDRVGHAKAALGERGEPWWQPATETGRRTRLRAAMLALAMHRSSRGSTICPSDAARTIGGSQWRTLMDDARQVARESALAGDVEIRQRNTVIDPAGDWTGPIRIALVTNEPTDGHSLV